MANPCAMIASVAMLLRHSLDLVEEAETIESALRSAIASGARTADIAAPGEAVLSTADMTRLVIQRL